MKKILLMISLLLTPIMVFASNGDNGIAIVAALAMEAFVSIHMSIFVFKPLASLISEENSKKTFWILFSVRVAILLFFDFFVTTFIAIFDFVSVFFGAFIVSIISTLKDKNKKGTVSIISPDQNIKVTTPITKNQISGLELKCSKCNAVMKITDKYCPGCGAPFDGNNVVVSENSNSSINIPVKEAVLPVNFDAMYSLTEDKMLEEFIKRELTKAQIDMSSNLIPSDILKRKKNFNIIFLILLFIYISIIFFHFPFLTYAVGLIILIIFFIFTRRYNLIKYLKKEIIARPEEKISNIVLNAKNTFVKDDSKRIIKIGILFAIIMPLIIFSSPRIIYEKVEGGYAVRYYTFGLTNFRTATIPATHKGKPVVTLRGNTFSNMPLLKSVKLPDSIKEIRGQAFKNCYLLEDVNIPNSLEYLGGGVFYNAKSIRRIELPDTLYYLGGESFYGASSLEYIKLSENLLEIRGDSFEFCKSLGSITIPDNVVRIGGHAFYGDTYLSSVIISENSKLDEIGSSAFRRCTSLKSILIPSGTSVNERAFKESPTIIRRYGSNYYNNDQDNYYY